MPLLLALLLLLALMGAGCSGSPQGGGDSGSTSGQGGKGRTLTVFAAASLTDAFGELAQDFENQNQGVKVRTNFAGSSTLAAQISQGAPADVFASADEAQMRNVADKGLVPGSPETFVENREVVIVPKNDPGGIEKFGDLSKPGLKLVLAQEKVPAAEYAEKILGKASKDPAYGLKFQQAVMGNLVSREDDVRAAVNRVVTGDADVTFGYASDVTPDIRDKVKVIQIPAGLNIVATYPVAAIKGAKDPELARRWVEFVLSGKGQSVLEKWGFEPAAGQGSPEGTT